MPFMFNLKEVRTDRGLSQNDFARLCDMTVSNIQKYEQQKMKSIPFETLYLFCEVLNCEPNDLLVKTSTLEMGTTGIPLKIQS